MELVTKFFNDNGLKVHRISKRDNEYNIFCPFHRERTASMFINIQKEYGEVLRSLRVWWLFV